MPAHSYRAMVTVDGKPAPAAILRHAHAKARYEFNLAVCVEAGLTNMPRNTAPGNYGPWYASAAATVDRSKIEVRYAEIFKRELKDAWSWARAIAAAGQGEAPANAVPQWREAA